MTTDTRYNGWTNYSTWNLALWIDNDQGSHSYWRDQARQALHDAKADGTCTIKERAALTLADYLKQEVEEHAPEAHDFYADILNAALSEVNYYEIAQHLVEDAVEEMAV